VALSVTLGSALVVGTCSTTREHAAPSVTPQVEARSPGESAAAAPPASRDVAPPLPASAAAPAPEPGQSPPVAAFPNAPGHELDHFYAALRALSPGAQPRASSHVRVAWLGDSHGACDLWSGPLRAALQARFGDGGPGFVHVGYKAYRHEGMRIEIKGRWAPTPRAPATSAHTGDGVFGLGGVLLTGTEGPRASLTVTDPAVPQSLGWDFCYKLGSPRDELTLSLTGAPDRTLAAGAGETLGVLRHISLTSAGASPTLRVTPASGQPALCGVSIEADPKVQPGVVLDTLGINGARLTTPLAWSEAEWVAELARRPPSLVVIEYGTNDASDSVIQPERFVDNLRKLMARVHEASPACDCVVLAPTDRRDTPERIVEVRDALLGASRASGCRFWDTYAIMGGRGAIQRWHEENPPRARGDGVHLTTKGYNDLGTQLAADVLSGYRP